MPGSFANFNMNFKNIKVFLSQVEDAGSAQSSEKTGFRELKE